MAVFTIDLTDAELAWVREQAERSGHENAESYLVALVMRDRERQEAIARIQAAVDEGIASGISTRSLDEVWDEARRRARELGLDAA